MDILEIIEKNKLSKESKEELISYISNSYDGVKESDMISNDHAEFWKDILWYAKLFGSSNAINTKLCPNCPINFKSPSEIDIRVYDSFAGKVPIIYVQDTNDFEHLVTNMVYKGERPDNITKIGASFVFGKTIRYIILSAKPYSNVPANELGIDVDEWREKSLLLRRDHECTHYFTKQTYGVAENKLHDELMADFIGMYNAFGFYKAEWFLRFMGIISGSGKRLIVYTKDLSPQVRNTTAHILTEAAHSLEKWSQTDEFISMSDIERIKVMCKKGLVGILKKI